MIAYNSEWLNNLAIVKELENALAGNLIDKKEKEIAGKLYPVSFYSPNIFIRIGLFILTVVIVCFSMGLVSVAFLNGASEKNFGVLIVFFGLINYVVLELIVSQKHHYHSGVDDSLLWMSGICIIGGFNLLVNISTTENAVLIFAITLYFLLRFANALMAMLAVLSFLLTVFLIYSKFGDFAKVTAPFLLLIFAAGIYFLAKNLWLQSICRHYKNGLVLVEITTLICAYFAVNYYVVREASIVMFNLDLKVGEGIPSGWLFWALTFVIPFVYIFRGLQKRDVVLLRVGLVLVAVVVFTVRYYYAFLPPEIEMTIGGLLLISVAYAVIQYLQQPKNGFTYEATRDKHLLDKMNIEAIVIAETFTTVQPSDNNTGFGGGSLGGGGATGDF